MVMLTLKTSYLLHSYDRRGEPTSLRQIGAADGTDVSGCSRKIIPAGPYISIPLFLYHLHVHKRTNCLKKMTGRSTVLTEFLSHTPPSGIMYVCKICHCLKKANGDRRRIEAAPHYFWDCCDDDDTNTITTDTTTTIINNNININVILTRWVLLVYCLTEWVVKVHSTPVCLEHFDHLFQFCWNNCQICFTAH